MSGDASPVPAQQRVGGNQPPTAAWPRQRLGDRAEQGPVIVGERRSVVLASQDRELVAQDDDLKIFGPAERAEGRLVRARYSVVGADQAKFGPILKAVFRILYRFLASLAPFAGALDLV